MCLSVTLGQAAVGRAGLSFQWGQRRSNHRESYAKYETPPSKMGWKCLPQTFLKVPLVLRSLWPILPRMRPSGLVMPSMASIEPLARYQRLNLAPYKGFVNPVMKEVKNAQGEVTDITLDYTERYIEQMLRYSKEYSFLPTYN